MKRRIARELAIQSLYQLEMNGVTPKQAVDTVIAEAQMEDNEMGIETKNVAKLQGEVLGWVTQVWERREELDKELARYLKGWQVDRLSRVDRQVLRFGCYELLHREDVPPKVAVNEAVLLAKYFGTGESGKFVNGVLGQMLRNREGAGGNDSEQA